MTIQSIGGMIPQAGVPGFNQKTDSYSKNLQNQIANAQKELQELSSNDKMSLEEKMKKREEIQKKINDLNAQLRQHEIDLRKEAMGQSQKQGKGMSMEDMLGGTAKGGNTKAGSKGKGRHGQVMSTSAMNAMISAGGSIKEAKVQGSVATELDGRSGVLEAEIKLDKQRGLDVEDKERELADVQQKAQEATASQISTLAEANKTLEEAAKEDKKDTGAGEVAGTDSGAAKTADKKDQRKGKVAADQQAGGTSDAGSKDVTLENSGMTNGSGSPDTGSMAGANQVAAGQTVTYTSVDIRL